MDLTPLVPPGQQVIERYGPLGFRISGLIYREPIIVFPDRTIVWPQGAVDEAGLAAVVADGTVELLLLGLGRRIVPVSAALRLALKRGGVAVEPMDTGAACRTYNVLLAEGRRVSAALLPPG
ncbi:MAG TPA: Mth938-like domain-containing protein [Stellaceae bacterium]|nr:Mth938-like domain-containing protein [Stellaceae bacterium]